MSELSDQLLEALDFQCTNVYKDVLLDQDHADIPGWDGFRYSFFKDSMMLVRRANLKCAGSAPFTSPQDAIDRTWDIISEYIAVVVFKAFADGVLLGQGNSRVVKKHAFFKKFDDLPQSAAFHEESKLYALNVTNDDDTLNHVMQYIKLGSLSLATAAGFKQTEQEHLNKVWDLWVLISHNISTSLFAAGYRLGAKWAQDEVLNGIMKASGSEG